MFELDKWREIGDSLWRHKLRTALTSISVYWGMFILVLLLGAGTGLQRGVEYQFRDDAVNSLWLRPGKTSMPYQGLSSGRNVEFKNEDYRLIKNSSDKIDHITGRFYLSGQYNITRGNKSSSFGVRCTHPDHRYLENTKITNGRFINDSDLKKFRKVCVIGVEVVKEMFEESEDPIGQYLTVKGVPYLVVGIFSDTGGRNENKQIYLPVTTAQRIESGQDRLHQLMFTLGDATVNESKAIEASVKSELARRHKFDPADEQAIYISNNLEDFERFQAVFIGIKTFIWIIGILTLIAGIIGISNIMLISVNERKKEIGLRKAIGATNGSIVSLIMQESVVLTAAAGFFGMMAGILILWGVDTAMSQSEPDPSTMFMNPGVTPGVVIGALCILVLSGALSGLIPALQSVRIAPAAAMKE